MTKEEQDSRVLFLIVLAQCFVEQLIELGEVGVFKLTQKQEANRFKESMMKIVNKDFGTPKAAEELFGLSEWVTESFGINFRLNKMPEETIKNFEEDWKELLNKYGL